MAIVPKTINGSISFFEQRIDRWTTAPTSIGITAAQAASLGTMITDARTAFTDAEQARMTSKDATATMRTKVNAMNELGGDLIKTIRAFAETTNNPNVYVLASIPAPKSPQPAGVPNPPENVVGSPQADGSIVVKWTGSLAFNTVFSVWRKLAGESTFEEVASVREKTWKDISVPAGIATVSYYVVAWREAGASDRSAEITVNLGAFMQQQAAMAAGGAGGVKLAA